MIFCCAQCSAPLFINARLCAQCGSVWDHPVPAGNAPGYEGIGACYWPPRQQSVSGFKIRQALGVWDTINPVKKLWTFGTAGVLLLFMAIGSTASYIHSKQAFVNPSLSQSAPFPMANNRPSPTGWQGNQPQSTQSPYASPQPQMQPSYTPPVSQPSYTPTSEPSQNGDQEQQQALSRMQEQQQQAIQQQKDSMDKMRQAQVDSLRSQVHALKNERDDLQAPIIHPDLYGGMGTDAYYSAEKAYNTQTEALDQQIDALNQQINSLSR